MEYLFFAVVIAIFGSAFFIVIRKKGTKSVGSGTPYTQQGGIRPTDNSTIIPQQNENTQF